MTAVVALGGNTLLRKGSKGSVEQQLREIETTVQRLPAVLDQFGDLVLTHGNGPQVGNLLLQQTCTAEVPELPLDVLVAETQAQIGYLLQRAVDNELDRRGVTLVTQVRVDPEDPAFRDPTKPVGPFYTAGEATEKPFETREVGSGEARFRRVVPSPEPLEVVERDEISALLDAGRIVVCCGGGGVPVTGNPLRGVEAVVDKDRSSGLLAAFLDAEALVILTDVDAVYLNYGTEGQEVIREAAPDDMERYLEGGEFPEGSMGPKVEACVDFVRSGGDLALITSPEELEEALRGEGGTWIS